MLTWLLALAALYPLLWLLRVVLVTRALLGISMRRQAVRPEPIDEVPTHLRDAARLWRQQLETQEFHSLGGWHISSGIDRAYDHHCLVFASRDGTIRAVVRSHVEAAKAGECFLILFSTTASGTEIVTATHGVAPAVPYPSVFRHEIVPDATVADLLARHRVRVRELGEPLWACSDNTNAAAREQMVLDGLFAVEEASPKLSADADGVLHYRFFSAVARAWFLLREARRRGRSDKRRAPLLKPELPTETLAQFDLESYRQMRAVNRGQMALRYKSIFTAVSFVLFAAALWWRMSPVVAITIVVALVFHEGGHLFGMWLFGYRDTQLLFLPFLGGVAIGHDTKVIPPWQHVVILLLGPLPGIFISLLLLVVAGAYGAPSWVHEVAMTTLVMNAFNLLPVHPLDGGQLVDCAVTARFPRARVVFLTFSALALILVGLLPGSVSYIGVGGVAILLSTRREWKLAQLRRDLREEFPGGGEEETVVLQILQRLRGPEWAKVKPVQRLKHASALQYALRTPPPGLGTFIATVAGVSAPLWLGLPLALSVGYHARVHAMDVARQKAEASGILVAAPTPANVNPEDNAAYYYAMAEELYWSARKREGSEQVRLLRIAASKNVFVPLAPTAKTNEARLASVWMHGSPVQALIDEASQRARYGQFDEAIGALVDALRLVRMMDSAPNWLTWQTHQQLVSAAQSALEEALVAGAHVTKAQASTLESLLDENAEVAFAARAIPPAMVKGWGGMEDLVETSWYFRLLLGFSALSGQTSELAGSADRALAARDQLRQIESGQWPTMADVRQSKGVALIEITQLADLVARDRMAELALQLNGVAVTNLPTLVHPLTQEAMHAVSRGSYTVLTLAAATGKAWDEADTSALEWRLRSP